MLPVTLILAVLTLPDALIVPATFTPVAVTTATLAVPPMVTARLPPEELISALDVPLVILVTLTAALSPVSCDPLPRK